MFGLGATELIVILVIVLVLFGTKKLKTLGSDLGTAIKGFRQAVTSEPSDKPVDPPRVIDIEVDRTGNKP